MENSRRTSLVNAVTGTKLSGTVQKPSETTVPCGLTWSMAAAIAPGRPTASNTTSGGPPRASRTAAAASATSALAMKALAPTAWAIGARRAEAAITATRLAPSLPAQKAAARPMGPAPVTSTRAPIGRFALRTPSSPTARGSIKAPSSSLSSGGSTTQSRAPTREYSLKP